MTESLSTSISKLRKSTARLNQITDQASDTVRELEEFLNRECSVGIHAFVKVKDVDNGDFTFSQWLEYRRVGQKYRIAVVWGSDIDPEEESVKAWSDCSRDEKLEAVAKLPDLIEVIAEKVNEKVESAQAAAGTAQAVLKALTGKEGA